MAVKEAFENHSKCVAYSVKKIKDNTHTKRGIWCKSQKPCFQLCNVHAMDRKMFNTCFILIQKAFSRSKSYHQFSAGHDAAYFILDIAHNLLNHSWSYTGLRLLPFKGILDYACSDVCQCKIFFKLLMTSCILLQICIYFGKEVIMVKLLNHAEQTKCKNIGTSWWKQV